MTIMRKRLVGGVMCALQSNTGKATARGAGAPDSTEMAAIAVCEQMAKIYIILEQKIF